MTLHKFLNLSGSQFENLENEESKVPDPLGCVRMTRANRCQAPRMVSGAQVVFVVIAD